MRVLVVGGSGLVGRRLLPALLVDGHDVLALSRDPDAHSWPDGVSTLRWDGEGQPWWPGTVEAAVNLAGERVLPRRWTDERREELRASRVHATNRLVKAMNKQRRATVLVNASATGYYGARPEGPCPEDRGPGDGWLAQLCADWEAAAGKHHGRTVLLRNGHILDPGGGLLGELLPLYRRGLGGVLGSGQQPWPWVHWFDAVGAVRWALANPRAEGPYNVAAPETVDQGRFHALLNLETGHARSIPYPAWALRLRFGEAASVLVGGQEAAPERLVSAGYGFRFPRLQGALYDLLHPGAPDTSFPEGPAAPAARG